MSNKPGFMQITALSGVPFAMVLGNSMIIPVLPAIKEALHLSSLQTSLIITLFSIPAALIIPLAGFLSDRYGRKIVIVPALILYGIGGVIAGLTGLVWASGGYPLLLGGRVLQGLGAAGTAPIAMALCGDLFKGRQRSKTLGIIEASNGFGKVLSPILGALIGMIAWYAPFLFFPLIVIPIVLGLIFWVKEPEAKRAKQKVGEYIKSIKEIFAQKTSLLLSSFFSGMTALLLLFGILYFLSEYLEEEYGMNGVTKGLVLAIPVLFMCVASLVTGSLIKKKYVLIKWVVFAGLAVITASLSVPGFFADNTWLFFAAISAAGLGTGMTLPCLNTIITSSTETNKRGLITSLYGSVRFLGVAMGPPLFGFLMGFKNSVMFWGASALAALAALLALFFIRVSELKKKSH